LVRHALILSARVPQARRGRETSSPPQFGHTPSISAAHAAQNVHSKLQIVAVSLSAARATSHRSHTGRISNIAPAYARRVRVFLTGGSGFVGSHTTRRLLDDGHEVRLLVRDEAKASTVLERVGVDPSAVDLVKGDVLDRRSIEDAVRGCDAAVHAAAAIGVTGKGGSSVVDTNVQGTINVVGSAVEAGIDPVVHLSTVGIFIPPVDPVITTTSVLADPRTDYGRSKLAAERAVRALQADEAPIVVVYPGGVIGPDQPALDATLEGIRGARETLWPLAPGGVALIDVRDLAEIIVRSLVPGEGPRRFMAGGHFLTWAGFADLTDEITGIRCRRMPMPAPVTLGMGWLIDQVRRIRPIDYPLTLDAAEFMVRMVPTDDEPTLRALGMSLRPVRDTVEDAMRWMAATGHLSPKAAGRLA
jgi:nucleoside-diphosphate-sugar epimerase